MAVLEMRSCGSLLLLLLFVVGDALAAGGLQQSVKAPYTQTGSQDQALESVPASEVEYVEGPLAPLYDFLIQRRLQRFCKLLREAGLEDVLKGLGGSWTLFTPTDASFIFLPGGTLEQLQRNPQLLRDFLLYHFVAGDLPSTMIQNEMLIDSVQGSPLRFNIYGQVMTVAGAQILEPDLQFELGRVHIVDHPLYPIPDTDIVSYLQRNYREFYRLLIDAGLADYISSGTFTLFVPDDEAFSYLSLELRDALAANKSLAERVLLNHILPGSVYTGGIIDGMQWETVGGVVITFTVNRGITFVNGIPVVVSDTPLTNGVIHVVNRVLLPEGVEADCQCKPSSDSSQKPQPQVSGGSRPVFDQTPRPQFDQGPTTRRPGQTSHRQTQRPIGGQSPAVPGIPGRTTPVGGQLSPQRPGRPAIGQGPFTPSRSGYPARQQPSGQPIPPPLEVTRPPYEESQEGTLPEDDLNVVVGPGIPGQKRPEQTRTTRYPPLPPPRGRPQPPRYPTPPPRTSQVGQQPSDTDGNGNYPDQDTPAVTQRPRQTNRWSNRQQTPVPRYPTPARTPYRPPVTTRRPQTTRSYDRVTQPTIEKQPGVESETDSLYPTQNPNQVLETQRPGSQPTSWQQRKQAIKTTRPPTQRTTFRPARVPPPPQRRPTYPRPGSSPPVAPVSPTTTDEPFESNRQKPTCRHRGDRVIPSTQNLPLCTELAPNDCQGPPFNPSDPRPLCPVNVDRPDCRDPSEPFSSTDTRPLCPSPVPEPECRAFGQPTYVGDRRPICRSSPATQTGCREPTAPYNPSDTRPLCRTTTPPRTPPTRTTTPRTQPPSLQQGCRRSDEPSSPQDTRPLCPGVTEPEQDCRPFLERPKPGDRRPVCRVNRQPSQRPQPARDSEKGQRRPVNVPQQPPPSRGRYPTQTTRRQSWQTTTQAPESTFEQTNVPGQQPVGKQPQPGSGLTQQPQSGTFQSRPQPGSHQSEPGVDSQPPSGSYPSSQPQTGSYPSQPQSGQDPSQPQSGTHPSQPQSGSQPFQPQTGSYPSRPQVGSRPPQPQRESYPSQPQTGSYPSQPQPGSQPSRPQTGSFPSQPQTGSYPSRPQTGSYPSQPQTGSYPSQPQVGSQPPQPQTGSYPTQPQTGSYPSQPQTEPQAQVPPRGYPQSPQITGPRQPSGSYPTPPRQGAQSPYPQTGVSQPSSLPGCSGIRCSTQPASPVSVQGRQPGPGRGSTTTRVPISVTGTSTTPGEDTRRTLYEIVEDPALLIRGRPVKLTKIFQLFHKAGIEDILSGPGPTTVFLPSDDAFATLPQGVVDQLEENPDLLRQVLLYHVTSTEILPSAQGESYIVPSLEGTQLVITMLNGGRLILISGAKAVAVTRANNGIFYVINQLLYPLPHQDIVGAIQSRPDLSILAWLLPMSGLTGLLQGQTPYTLLAPTDNAFAQLPPAVYDELTRNTTALQEILLNHVIEGAHYGREFLTGGVFPSARGGKLKFQVVSYGYQVNDVNIKTPEIVTGTGVVHLIDQVLLEEPDLQFFTNLENSLAGQDGSLNPPQQPSVGGQQPGGGQPGTGQPGAGQAGEGQPGVVGRIPSSGHRTPQEPQQPGGSGLQPGTAGQRPGSGHGTPVGHRPSAGQQPTGLQPAGRQPVTGGQRPVPGQRPATGVRQPVQGQGRPGYGGQTSAHLPQGNRRPQTGQGAFVGQRQPATPSQVPGSVGGHGTDISVHGAGGQHTNVADLARSMGLNRFASWITNTGLLEKVHDGGVYTIFAPTDDAINSLPQEMVYSMDSNPDQVMSLLQYHIIPQRLNLNSLGNEETSSTLLQGKKIRFNVYQNVQPDCKQIVTASGTPVQEALANMGSVQIIPVSQVLYQPTGDLLKIVEASPILQKLSEAVRTARLTWVLSGTGPLTFFAPSDTAFQSLPAEEQKRLLEDKQAFSDLLKRHMLRGTIFSSGVQEEVEKRSENGKPITINLREGVMTVNSIPVTYNDITATNGVLHVIDQFL